MCTKYEFKVLELYGKIKGNEMYIQQLSRCYHIWVNDGNFDSRR